MKKDVVIPNLGGVENSKIIEILVKVKQSVDKNDPLLALESDKASMDVPSPYTGVIESIHVKEGDTVSEGDIILSLNNVKKDKEVKEDKRPEKETKLESSEHIYASPFVRRMAYELDIDLSKVKASGNGGRITIDDMKAFLLRTQPQVIDYSKWGKVSFEVFNQLRSKSAAFLVDAWQTVPQVTQHHWIDITELEEKRKGMKEKITMVSFMMKAMTSTMKKHPVMCRGWVNEKEYVLRSYIHIGIAMDTDKGLIVPVCKDVDKKDIVEIAKEIVSLTEKAKEGELQIGDLEGRCASISSLGSIGGGHFTPIVATPDAFVLGVSRAVIQPVYQDDDLVKRLMLPISLSYDHRLIDGADAARFLLDLEKCLVEIPGKVGE